MSSILTRQRNALKNETVFNTLPKRVRPDDRSNIPVWFYRRIRRIEILQISPTEWSDNLGGVKRWAVRSRGWLGASKSFGLLAGQLAERLARGRVHFERLNEPRSGNGGQVGSGMEEVRFGQLRNSKPTLY